MENPSQIDSENAKYIESVLCDAYKFLGVNKVFGRVIARLLNVRKRVNTFKM